jgi:hypothetical protein
MISKAIIVGTISAVLLPDPAVWAADKQDVEELRGEVRQLQAQVQDLRSVVASMAELDRRESALLSRAFSGGQSSPEPASSPVAARSEADDGALEPSPSRVSSASAERPSRSRHRRHRSSSKSRSKAGRSSSSR